MQRKAIVKRLLWLLAGLASVSLAACTPLGLLAANSRAAFGHFDVHTDLAYGSGTRQRLDLYLPKSSQRKGAPGDTPIVIFLHGGGWNSGDKAQYRFVGAALAERGVIAVLPNYSLYPQGRFPDFMRDVAQATAWVRQHASEWQGNAQAIFLAGHSAGAHIATLLALDDRYLSAVGGSTHWIRGVIGLAGPYDFLPFRYPYMYDLFGPTDQLDQSQPIHFVHDHAPDMLLMHGLKDTVVAPDNTRHLAAVLREHHNVVLEQYIPGATHGDLVAAFSPLARSRAPVLDRLLEFIESRMTGQRIAQTIIHTQPALVWL